MNQDLSVRSMLVDNKTGRLIKAVNEQGLDDYVQLFTKSNEKSEIIIFDFSSAVTRFHEELDRKLGAKEYQDLMVKRGTVFNTWVRLKSLTNEMMLCQAVSQVSRDSEEVLNWIYTRLPELEMNYRRATDGMTPGLVGNEKNRELLKLSNEIDAFLEVLMCNVHATVKVDVNYFKTEFILNQHCLNIRKIVCDALKNEMNYHRDHFLSDSMIYQCCMEDLEINAEALLIQIEAGQQAEEIRMKIKSDIEVKDIMDHNNNPKRGYTVSWPRTSTDNIDRVKILSRLLQKIDSVIVLLGKLKEHNVIINKDKTQQEVFESKLESLVFENKA